MNRPRKAVEAALEKKGFQRAEGDHHYFYLIDGEGRRTAIFTKTSHSPKHRDLGDPLLGQMAVQLRLKKPELLDLIDCHLTEAAYRARLRDKGISC